MEAKSEIEAEVALSAKEAVSPDLIVPASVAKEAVVATFDIDAVPAVWDAVVALSANDAVTVGAKPFALVATDAVCAVVAIEALVAVLAMEAVAAELKVVALIATEAVWANIAVEADVAVTVGDKEFARKATDAVWAVIATEDVSIEPEATTPVNNVPSPLNDPVNDPVTELSSAWDPETITFFQLGIYVIFYSIININLRWIDYFHYIKYHLQQQ